MSTEFYSSRDYPLPKLDIIHKPDPVTITIKNLLLTEDPRPDMTLEEIEAKVYWTEEMADISPELFSEELEEWEQVLADKIKYKNGVSRGIELYNFVRLITNNKNSDYFLS